MKFNLRKIFIIAILVICIIAINLAVYFAITQKPQEKQEEIIIDTAILIENFNNIFDNKVDYQNNDIKVEKEDNEKEIIYTSYFKQEVLDKSYDVNINIPYININSDAAKSINNEINNLFYNKANDILESKNVDSVYNVKYKAYVNENILSLIINATLKEGNNPQRTIMKTYNYNLSSNSELGIKEILQYRTISKEYAQKQIKETIKVASENARKYQELGYTKYLRDINDNIYILENTKVYFIGENKAIYIIYPYGNSNYTSEVDLLVI